MLEELAASGMSEEDILEKTQLLMKAFGKEDTASTAEYRLLRYIYDVQVLISGYNLVHYLCCFGKEDTASTTEYRLLRYIYDVQILISGYNLVHNLCRFKLDESLCHERNHIHRRVQAAQVHL